MDRGLITQWQRSRADIDNNRDITSEVREAINQIEEKSEYFIDM